MNTIYRQQLPRTLLKGRRSYSLAIDLTLVPYHGKPHKEDAELVRGEAKAGTTHFHGYATVAVVHDKRRYVLALRFVKTGETMADIVRWLLDRVKQLKIKVRRVYLDKGFCSVDVFKTLARRRLAYIVPIPVRGKSGGIRRVFTGRASYWTDYTMNSPTAGRYTLRVASVRRYSKKRYGRHGIKWFAYAVAGLPPSMSVRQVFQIYRQRFGIETSYRQMNQVRARTTSRNPVLRLLLVGLAFILVNMYVALRERLWTPNLAALLTGRRFWFSLRRLAFQIGRAVEHHLGVAPVVQLGKIGVTTFS